MSDLGPTFWLTKSAAGKVRGGTDEWVNELTASGWMKASGSCEGSPVSEDDAFEALAALCGRAHDARLLHCSVDDPKPWPDAPGPWRIEVSFRVLWPEDEP